MRCANCGKNKAVTFRREGGLIPGERLDALRSSRKNPGMEGEIKGYDSICLTCIKAKMKAGTWLKTPIITNPTIKPTGDPLEWVLNDE